MATTSYTIVSDYVPQDHQGSHESAQQEELEPDTWHFDPSYHSKPLPPRFVPASLPLDQWRGSGPAHSTKDPCYATLGADVSLWYRSLRSPNRYDGAAVQQKPEQAGENQATLLPHPQPFPSERRNKNNWFIMKAIQSEPAMANSPSPSLADMIARDPPPLSTEPKYYPPVWLEIGPANKGFEMLQRRGWSEGEPLGPDVIRRHVPESSSSDMIPFAGINDKVDRVTQEMREVKVEGHDDVSEWRRVDVIDLTESDIEEGSPTAVSSLEAKLFLPPEHTVHNRTALVTPIPTVLKSDRLGIGLKAKTVGPYKASQKRVTHNAAALAAHIKAGEDRRKRKKAVGRGRRGYAKQQNGDEAERRRLLAYMNG